MDDLQGVYYKYFAQHLVAAVTELAAQAKQQYRRRKSEFNHGYFAAFHTMLDRVKQEALACSVDTRELGLADYDPDAQQLL
jgi:hypothetical protein